MNYNYELLNEYNKRLKVKEQDFLAFSKGALKKYCKGKNYVVVGEVKKEKLGETADLIVIGGEQHNVKPLGSHSALLNRKAGYVCVGEDSYVAILKSRVPFLIMFLALLAGIIIGGYILWSMLTGNSIPVVSPDHPLPDVDSNIVEIEGDTSTPNRILFKNPKKSNHDVALELYVVKNNERILISKSGRIPAGNKLQDMSLMPDKAVLSEGVYEGVFKVIYYNPQTGERALVESDISDVEIIVKN